MAICLHWRVNPFVECDVGTKMRKKNGYDKYAFECLGVCYR